MQHHHRSGTPAGRTSLSLSAQQRFAQFGAQPEKTEKPLIRDWRFWAGLTTLVGGIVWLFIATWI